MMTLGEIRIANRQACEGFVDAAYADLYRWFHWLTNDVHQAADLVQATFLAFWESLGKGAGAGAGEASIEARHWLFGIGRNVWRSHCRQKERSPPTAAGFLEKAESHSTSDDQTASELASAAECAREIRVAVGELPIEVREAVTLRYWHDFSYAEIGQVLEISEVAARQRAFQGREWLRRRLKTFSPAPDATRDQPAEEGTNR